MKPWGQLAAAMLLGLALAGCASGGDDRGAPSRAHDTAMLPREQGRARIEDQAGQKPLQCAPYAREHSQVKIYGDAYTWWDKAAGHYARVSAPASGSVMVLHNYAGSQRSHLAVVRSIVSAREIRVDHANWLNDGSVYVNDPVADVSQENDWSAVRVWNIKTGGWGTNVYEVQGFIGSAGAAAGVADGRAAPGAGAARLARAEPGETAADLGDGALP